MIRPVLQNEAFLANVEQARTKPEFLHLWWLGQSGFLVLWQGRHLLLDPYLSDSLTRKYAATDKPHVRMTEHVVDPTRLDFIDVVTSSHNHTDHLDQDTLKPLLKVNPRLELVIPEANRELVVNRLEIMAEVPRGLDAGQSVTVAGFKIHAVPAAHNELEKDPWGRHKFLGYVVEAGPCTLYHSGDTRWYEGMEERLKQWRVDIALLPINGDDPSRRVAGNLNGAEAADLAKAIKAGLVIPCHYQMFEFNTACTSGFAARAQEIGQHYQILQCGEHWSNCGMR